MSRSVINVYVQWHSTSSLTVAPLVNTQLTVFWLSPTVPNIFRSSCVYQPVRSSLSLIFFWPRNQIMYLGGSRVPRTMQCSATLLPAFTKRLWSPISSVLGSVNKKQKKSFNTIAKSLILFDLQGSYIYYIFKVRLFHKHSLTICRWTLALSFGSVAIWHSYHPASLGSTYLICSDQV